MTVIIRTPQPRLAYAAHDNWVTRPRDHLCRWLATLDSTAPPDHALPHPDASPNRKRQRAPSRSMSRRVKQRTLESSAGPAGLPTPSNSVDDELLMYDRKAIPAPQEAGQSSTSQRAYSPWRQRSHVSTTMVPLRSPGTSSTSAGDGSSLARLGSVNLALHEVQAEDSASQMGDLQGTRFRNPSPKKLRSRSLSRQKLKPTRQRLAELTPPVAYYQLREWEELGAEDLPREAEQLFVLIDAAIHDEAFIPDSLRKSYQSSIPKIASHRSKDSMYYKSEQSYDEWDRELWKAVNGIIRKMTRTEGRSEAQLTNLTVEPILELVSAEELQLACQPLLKRNGLVCHHNVSTAHTIRADSTASSSTATSDFSADTDVTETVDFALAKKRIDHVLSISFRNDFECLASGATARKARLARSKTLVRLCDAASLPASINQTAAFPHDAFFVGIEVKKERSTVTPEIQLAAWLSAGQSIAGALGFDTEVPRVTITVVGHLWCVYVCFSLYENEQIVCVGPLEIGSTRSEEGIFRIVHVLRKIVEWGNTKFRGMVSRGMIERLDGLAN